VELKLENLSLDEQRFLRHATTIELWRKGNIRDWYLKPKQKSALEFLRTTVDPFLEASRRWGKTTTVLDYVIEESIVRNGIVTRWCEPWKNQCREIVMTEMDKIQSTIPKRYQFKWSGTDSFYQCDWNNSRIYLRGVNEDRGESARGTHAHIVVADELGSWRHPKYILDEVLGPQLLTTNGTLVRTGTPPRNFTHLYYELKDAARIAGTFLQRTIHDQEIASWDAVEKAIARAGGWDSPAVRREYLCEKVIDTNFAIIPEWDDKYIVAAEPDEFFPFYLKYSGLDIGVRDLTVVLIAYYDFRRAKLVVLDEIVMNGPQMTTDKLAEAQRAKESQHFGVRWESVVTENRVRWSIKAPPTFRMRRVSDIDLLLVQDLSRLHGLFYEATDKGELEEMVNEVRMWVGAGRVEVHPRCAITIDSLRYGLWDEDRKVWERSDRLGHFDALAALMYLLRNVDSRTNPIPSDFGKPAEDYFFQTEKAARGDKFKKIFNVK
jgi:hypothetical protein